MIIYQAEGTTPVRYKIGDGVTLVDNLPFAVTAGEKGVGIKSIEPVGGDHTGSLHRITLDNGETYDFYVENGRDGEDGEDGTSVLIDNITLSTESGGANVVEFSDGDSMTIWNGKDGKSAYEYAQDDGYPGTETEYAEFMNPDNVVSTMDEVVGTHDRDETAHADIRAQINQLSSEKVVLYSEQNLTAEQKAQARANIGAAEDSILEMVNSIEECVDTSKRYVLPDGYIYAWTYGEHIIESKNHILSSINDDGTPYNGGKGYKEGYRLNSSGVESAASDTVVSGFIPYNGEDIELRIPNTGLESSKNYLHIYNSDFSIQKATSDGTIIDGSYRILMYWVRDYGATATVESATGTIKYIIPKESIYKNAAYIRVAAGTDTAVNSSTFDLALNEGLDDSEVIIDYSWQNTGLYYGSPDTGNRLDELETTVDNHEERLITLESGDIGNNDTSTDVPEYWKEHLVEKADAIQVAMEEAGRNKSAFLWYTDAHWPSNSKMSPKLLNYLIDNTSMNKVNFGGDIVGDPLPHDHENTAYVYEWRKAIANLSNHHSVYGNHDLNHRSTDVSTIAYAQLLASEESSDMCIGGDSYYYIDNPAEKTRYLYLSYFTTSHTDMMAQGEFITSALTTLAVGWHMVVIAHRWWQYNSSANPTTGAVPAYESDILSIFDAYNARKTRSGSNYFQAQDFTEAKGKVEFCIGGHIHVDYDIESEGGIPIIITTADANQNRVPDSDVDSGTVGTTTEAAVYGIIADYNDPNNTKITVVGVGRGTSRVISNRQAAYPYAISNVAYSGDKTAGAAIDLSKFSFTVHYTNDSSVEKMGASSCSRATILEGQNTYTIVYSENGVEIPSNFVIVGEATAPTNLLNLDRTYVTGTVGESIGLSYLDESKAYTNVVQGTQAFNASACTVSGIAENGVTVKEAGIGGMSVAYPVYLPDISTNSYILSFDYTGDGSSRVWYKYATAAGVIDQNVPACNKTGSGHIDYTIPSASGFAWLIIFVGANTGKTTTLSNVSLTKA